MDINLDRQAIAEHLAGLVQCKTVSYSDPAKVDGGEFLRLHRRLEEYFPLLHEHLEKRVVDDYGLLYRWRGRSDAKPILLMAHQDVVPAEEEGWEYPPFSGAMEKGCVWGRGAIDIKCMLCSEMEAVEYLLGQGYVPEHDVYLAYGCDEEVNSKRCARDTAALLQSEGVQLALVMDEGDSFVPGEIYDSPGNVLACIGVCEKGYLDLVLEIEGPGGHAANPPEESLIGQLTEAVVAVQAEKLPARLPEAVAEFYKRLAPLMKNGKLAKLLTDTAANREEICDLLERSRRGNASIRTTTAATMAQGSPAPNILPQKASATINFRLAPGDSVERVTEHVRKIVNNDRISITRLQAEEASEAADMSGDAYKLMERTVLDVFTGVNVLPTMLFGATDSRHFQPICDNIFKFLPLRCCMELGHTIHSQNERVPIDGLEKGAEFFIRLITSMGEL